MCIMDDDQITINFKELTAQRIGAASAKFTPSGIWAASVPLTKAYCWKVPFLLKPELIAFSQLGSNPSLQYRQARQVEFTH